MTPVINNEKDLAPYLKRFAVWRTLFWWEAGKIDAAEAARRIGLSESDADWLRRVALDATKVAILG